MLLVQADIPRDAHVLPGLRLLDALVVVRLCLHQGPKDVLVDVCILIPSHAELRIRRPKKHPHRGGQTLLVDVRILIPAHEYL